VLGVYVLISNFFG